MFIKEKTNQVGLDFGAIYQCEYCGHVYSSLGYDDDDFYEHILPNMRCTKCENKTAGHFPLDKKQYDIRKGR